MTALIGISEIEAAAERIAGHVVRTPTLRELRALRAARRAGHDEAGAVAAHGFLQGARCDGEAAVAGEAELAAGVVAVSGGNHGIALAVMAAALDVKATVVMPRSAPARSVALVEAAGASLRLTDDMPSAFALVNRLRDEGLTLVHPFDDPVVIAGQGTVGLEFAEDAGELTDVLVSIGGGGLIAGVAAALHARRPGIRVWGVETEGAEAMSAALAAGGPVPVTPSSIVTTLSAPAVSQLTYDHVSALVTEVLTVPDREAVQGCLDLAEHAKVWTEPAAGCLLPAARQVLERVGDGARLGLVVCGGNATVGEIAAWSEGFGLR
jgi:threonine dehydratase